ncbi:MAG TPA: nickel-binding protein [Flavobacterium sp.]|uniref:nickel-binding protein n=1 Tax=Flavobacterium sp. TaxID=239 RepID=UPI002F3EAEFF
MPIYMDRHDVSETVTAEHVAQLHQADLKVQDKFNCRGLTYWFDENRKTAFCLIEAPNKEAIKEMHNHAHGDVPHRIIEVDDSIVESFLGRIEDPVKAQKTELNIINDPAFRIIMVVRFNDFSLKKSFEKENQALVKIIGEIHQIISKLKGRVVKQNSKEFLISFTSVTDAVLGALEIQSNFESDQKNKGTFNLKIVLGAGVPVTEKEGLFENTIEVVESIYRFIKGQVVITDEVKDLYESENLNKCVDDKFINVLKSSDEQFLNNLMACIEKNWDKTDLKANDFCEQLGYSKSQLYRKMMLLTGKSPNSFVKEYRLNMALQLLNKQIDNISEIAFKTGFNSPTYFSKCFKETFGILPSNYTKETFNKA